MSRKKILRAAHSLIDFSMRSLITDRIHGMLFAAVTGTPCIALDNVSKKVSGAYEWIQYLDYIQFKDEEAVFHHWSFLYLS